jgi:staphylococcal nuclease domain-containing protein 1
VKPRGATAPVNLGLELLKEGLAEGARTTRYEEAHRKAEAGAQAARKRIWADYDPEKAEAEKKARDEVTAEVGKPRKELMTVTEVIDGSTFYVQVVGDEQKRLETLMADVAAKGYENAEPYTPKAGEAVAAQFSGDNAWYRAKVGRVLPAGADRKETEVEVLYADYGNAETVPVSRVRKLDAEHSPQALRWQAREASLAYIVPRPVEEEWGKEAALFFKELVWDKTLLATIEYREADREHLSLWTSDGYTFINGELLRAGLGKLPKRIPRGANKTVLDFLRAAQDEAFRSHAGIWEYGDDGEDDDYAY